MCPPDTGSHWQSCEPDEPERQLPALHPLSRILGHVCEVLLLLYERCPAFPWGILVGSLGVVCLTEKKYFKKCEGAR